MRQFADTKLIYVTRYEATDGTVFDSKEECEKYEKTAEAVIKGAFNKTFKMTSDNYVSSEGFISATFYECDRIFAIIIENEDELAVCNRWLKQIGSSHVFGVSDLYKSHVFIRSEDGDYWYTGKTIEGLNDDYGAFLKAIERTAMRRFKQEQDNASDKKTDSDKM